jgi:hypothetical protein
MAKQIALKDSVVVDDTDLSTFCKAWTPTSEFNLVDVSGFNASGTDENLVGARASSVTATFFDAAATGEVHGVLYPAHINRDIISFVARRDQNAPVSADNPECRGHVYVQNYNPSRTRGDVATYDVSFIAADADGIQWYDAAS